MTKHKYTSVICIVVVVFMLAVTVCFALGENFGLLNIGTQMPYVEKLFSTDRVHTLDIVVDGEDWENMLENASAKEYIQCSLVLDGEAVKSVGIRTKGNSSLSSIQMSDSDRYSFKIEFDHYVDGKTYYGLDKLALNNITQDNTYLKDYISYRMMEEFEADTPLTSFIWITVNNEDWGLYLAVEGIEESFAQRKYGNNYGQIYKPDSMNMNFNRDDDRGGGMERNMPFNDMEDMDFSQMEEWFGQMMEEGGGFPEMMDFGGGMPQMPGAGDEAAGYGDSGEDGEEIAAEGFGNRDGFGGFGGMGSTDVALVYTDDEYDSYKNIFDNAKFSPTDSDKNRLISSLKQINEGENLDEVMNIDEVLRYFVVHNFVLNFDSYTGSMIHNYYLYEEDGVLSMIAWDYNLAFGGFDMGMGMNSVDSVTAFVNYPIDSPVSGGDLEDRPMIGQLLLNEEYLEMYHEYFGEFISDYFDSGKFEEEIDSVIALISPYVDKDPTAFCTYEEFLEASAELKEFCLLRAESIKGQLDGSIPADSEGQSQDSSSFIDASHVNVDAMGSSMSSFGNARMGGERHNLAVTGGEETQTAEGDGDLPEPGGGMGDPPEDWDMEDMEGGRGGEGGPPSFGDGEEMPDMGDFSEGSFAASGETEGNAPEGEASGGDRQFFPGGMEGWGEEAINDNSPYIYLGVSAFLLLVGLLFAWRFRH